VSINIIVAIAGICLIDLCYIFVSHIMVIQLFVRHTIFQNKTKLFGNWIYSRPQVKDAYSVGPIKMI
jgi:hypothetical protein